MKLLATVLLAASLIACRPAQTPREHARAVVLTLAEGVRIGDLACASYAISTKDMQLAEVCAALVTEAQADLITAEDGIDAWSDIEAHNLPCTAKRVTDVMTRLLGTLQRAGSKAPPALVDAIQFAPLLTGACNES